MPQMTQEEYLAILFADCGYDAAQRRGMATEALRQILPGRTDDGREVPRHRHAEGGKGRRACPVNPSPSDDRQALRTAARSVKRLRRELIEAEEWLRGELADYAALKRGNMTLLANNIGVDDGDMSRFVSGIRSVPDAVIEKLTTL